MKTILTGLTIVILLSFLLSSEPRKEDQKEDDEDKALREAYEAVLANYGYDIAKNVEKIHRLETENYGRSFTFNSSSAGMSAFGSSYPYGWSSLSKFWDKNPRLKPIGVYTPHDHWNQEAPLLAFPTLEAGLLTLAHFLSLNNNDAGRWHSKDEAKRIVYRQRVASIQNGYIV